MSFRLYESLGVLCALISAPALAQLQAEPDATKAGATASNGGSDCRMFLSGMHCFKPPQPTPATKAQMDELKARTIAEQKEILDKLGSDLSPENCEAAQAYANSRGRVHLADVMRLRCENSKNAGVK